jgi:hypothetical protein
MTESTVLETGGSGVAPSRQGCMGLIKGMAAEAPKRVTRKGSKQNPHRLCRGVRGPSFRLRISAARMFDVLFGNTRTKGWWSRLQGIPRWMERQNHNGCKRKPEPRPVEATAAGVAAQTDAKYFSDVVVREL